MLRINIQKNNTGITRELLRLNCRTHKRIQLKPAKDALLPLEIAPGMWLLSLRILVLNPGTDRGHVKAKSIRAKFAGSS